jgi:transcriptional regulator with XRE-family HTH domain
MPTSAVVCAWELGLRLRAAREQLGLTVGQAAQAIRMQPPNLSATEGGRKRITAANLAKLASVYEISAELPDLDVLRVGADARNWYHQYADMFNDEFIRYLGLEMAATSMSSYQSLMIHGLLQTEDYALAVIRGGSPYIRLTEVGPRTEARLIRQRRLSDDEPIQLSLLVTEGALRQRVGGPDVMRRQLLHLVASAEERPNVHVRVIPFDIGAYPAMGGPFTVLSFTPRRLPDVSWQETLTAASTHEKIQQVREYAVALAETNTVALNAQESIDLIREVAKEMK